MSYVWWSLKVCFGSNNPGWLRDNLGYSGSQSQEETGGPAVLRLRKWGVPSTVVCLTTRLCSLGLGQPNPSPSDLKLLLHQARVPRAEIFSILSVQMWMRLASCSPLQSAARFVTTSLPEKRELDHWVGAVCSWAWLGTWGIPLGVGSSE